MSKSKKNTVDPDDIIATYGADVARWFMLSDSPPDRDVIWSDERVQGASRFVQRLWRLVERISRDRQGGARGRPASFGADALGLRKAAHGALDKVSTGIERLHFNVCLAHIREFANALAEVLAQGRQAGRRTSPGRFGRPRPSLFNCFAPMMPHLAEECWQVLGQSGLVSEANWPQIERDLLVEDTVTLVVQVNGKKRGDVTVPRVAQNPEIEAAVLALDAVKLALGRQARPQGDRCSHEDRECRRLGSGSPFGCIAVAALAALTAGCFQPMYAEHNDGTPGLREKLMGVELPPVDKPNASREARIQVEIRNALAFKLYGNATGMPPTHRLVIRFTTTRSSLIVDPATGLPISENYGIDAQYNLIDLATNKSVMTGTTFSRVSYDIPGQLPALRPRPRLPRRRGPRRATKSRKTSRPGWRRSSTPAPDVRHSGACEARTRNRTAISRFRVAREDACPE